jgi:hypothetical protein
MKGHSGVLLPQINGQSTAAVYYSACIEKHITVVRYLYITLKDDSEAEHSDKRLCSLKVVNLLTS